MILLILNWFFYLWLFFTIIYGGFGLVLFLMQPKLMYRPTKDILYTPDELGLKFDDVAIETQDGLKISAWYIPAKNAKFTVLLCHGNGGNLMHRLDYINLFHSLGLNCLIFDYRGYGKSHGKPDEQGTYKDAAAAYKWLIDNKKVQPRNIIIYGQSLGGSIAAKLASDVQAGSLVLESSFTSFLDMAKQFYWHMPVKFFVRYSYNTFEYLTKITCPVLVIHSKDDEVVPFEFGQKIYETANEPKEFAEISGSHNDCFLLSIDIYRQAWSNWVIFLEKTVNSAKQNRA